MYWPDLHSKYAAKSIYIKAKLQISQAQPHLTSLAFSNFFSWEA